MTVQERRIIAILVRAMKRAIATIEKGGLNVFIVVDVAYVAARSCELTSEAHFREHFEEQIRKRKVELSGVCIDCEKNLADDSGFCVECGRKIDEKIALQSLPDDSVPN